MKVIIAGSRDIDNFETISWAIFSSLFHITEGVCGGAKGVDKVGENWCIWQDIPVKKILPDWDKYGKKAGILRNIEMGNYADALIAIWDGKSRGTKHMIDYMKSLNKPVFIYTIPDDN